MPDQMVHVIALADDDPDDRDIFQEVCAGLEPKVKVELYENGVQLLNALNSSNGVAPSIVFLDINMSGKDGFECLKDIRRKAELRSLCVIMYSTSVTHSDLSTARTLGANGFLQKPSDYGKLKAVVAKLLDIDWTDPCQELNEANFLITP